MVGGIRIKMGSLGPQKWTHAAGRLASRVVSLTGCRDTLWSSPSDGILGGETPTVGHPPP